MSGCAAVACSRHARSLQSLASPKPPSTSGAAKGSSQNATSDSLNRGLWKHPVRQTILKGCGGRDARPARLISITAQSPE